MIKKKNIRVERKELNNNKDKKYIF